MSRQVKVSVGTWCMAFGMDRPADLEQALKVAGAFGFDGVELAGFVDHVVLDRYSDSSARDGLRTMLDDLGLHPVLLAPAPHGAIARIPPWPTTDDRDVVAEHDRWWARYFEFAATLGIKGMRIDPGMRGPLPYGVDYNQVWDRVVEMYGRLAERGAETGCSVLWEVESGQPFNKPSEIVRLLDDVGHPNLQLLYDTAHFHAATVTGHNQVQPEELLEGGQVELIRRLRGRIGHVHLCDTDGDVTRNFFSRKIGFGKGVVDFEELLPVLVDCYEGEWWCVDVIPFSSQVWGDLWDGVAFVRDVVGRHVGAAAGPI
ncbi:sugar phosphate isomerase/epimerase family protein [Microbispora sp. NPDC046973]|uniref:sugar phosphate isomerase/epimerase family protein n=1 Tax=Microbispora sp. NPDC046973 TaxID=3155022 RepID=UPI00340C1B9F